MSEDVEIDQETYDRLIAEGKSERIARAKAKAAQVRKSKAAAGETLGPVEAEKNQAALASVRGGDTGGAGGGGAAAAAATQEAPTGRLSPEERAARVAASLGGDGNGQGQSGSLGVPRSSEHTHRLLALVPPTGIQQVHTKQQDKVYTWPHLLVVEFVALLAVSALLLVVSYFVDGVFRDLANPNLTPNPSKAPWYFLGL
ncbi:MAG TPA: hypothetical protein VGA69_00085, partial [Nitriliruptorales bacterium]